MPSTDKATDEELFKAVDTAVAAAALHPLVPSSTRAGIAALAELVKRLHQRAHNGQKGSTDAT